MFQKIVFGSLLMILALPSAGWALGECREDRKKYCPDAGLDEDKIKACLKDHYKDLSDPCKQLIAEKVEKKIEKKLESESK